MKAFALTQPSKMDQSISDPIASCQHCTKESESNPSLHLNLASTVAAAPFRATSLHHDITPLPQHQQPPKKRNNPSSHAFNLNSPTNLAEMAPGSQIMNEFMFNIDSIFDDEPSEGTGADVVYVEEPFSQQAFVPSGTMNDGIRGIVSSLESLDAVLDDEFMDFIKGY